MKKKTTTKRTTKPAQSKPAVKPTAKVIKMTPTNKPAPPIAPPLPVNLNEAAAAAEKTVLRNRIIILKEEALHEIYRVDTRFFATGGFGSMPGLMGRKISGYYLYDGESSWTVRAAIDWKATARYWLSGKEEQDLDALARLGLLVREHIPPPADKGLLRNVLHRIITMPPAEQLPRLDAPGYAEALYAVLEKEGISIENIRRTLT